jgi:6,7-dimethyl-8-ribityllumazine synthase
MTDMKSGYHAPDAPEPGEFANTRVAILATRWNTDIVDALIDGARACLEDWGVQPSNISEYRVPGAFEIPLACEHLARGKHFDGVIALGAVIRGDTPHFDFVAGECARGLQTVMLNHAVPIGFGVLTVNTVEQAHERSGPGDDNKGYESAAAVLEMIRFEWELESP